MADSSRRYVVSILGNSYTIVSDEDQAHVKRVGAYLDAIMQEIASQVGAEKRDTVIILAALKIASKLLHVEQDANTYTTKIREVVQKVDRMIESLH